MSLLTCYTDCQEFVNDSSVNVETASLIGGNTTLSAPALLGATSLSVVSVTGFVAGAPIWILDGPNSEIVANATVSGGNLSIPSGTQAAHAAGVNVASAGALGNLADILVRASAMVENLCRQGPDGGSRSLFAASRSEILSGPSMYRAVIDRDQTLILRPYHFPITAVTSISIQFQAAQRVAMDTSALVLPDGARMVQVPWVTPMLANGSAPPWYSMTYSRGKPFYVTLSYTGGPCASAALANVPYDIKEAVMFVALDRLAFRSNNLGGTMFHRGDVSFQHAAHTRGAGGVGGDSLFMMQAKEKLIPYMAGSI